MPLRLRNRKKPELKENDGNAQFSLCCTSKMPDDDPTSSSGIFFVRVNREWTRINANGRPTDQARDNANYSGEHARPGRWRSRLAIADSRPCVLLPARLV